MFGEAMFPCLPRDTRALIRRSYMKTADQSTGTHPHPAAFLSHLHLSVQNGTQH